MLLEEYIGLGRYKKSGGWLGHYIRQQMHDIRLHLPFKKEDEAQAFDEDGNPIKMPSAEKNMTPQQQEQALRSELAGELRERERKKKEG